MVQLPRDVLPKIYTLFMEEIKVRLESVRIELSAANELRDDALGIVHAEFAYLQIRRVAELIALAVVVAHNKSEDFRTKKFLMEYNADAMFERLARLNDEGFPQRFTVTGVTPEGFANVDLHPEEYLTSRELRKIYNACGDKLHAGKLRTLFKGPKRYDIGEIQGWARQIMQLLNDHVVILPERKSVMVVSMAKAPDGRVDCHLQDLIEAETRREPPHVVRVYRPAPRKD